MSEDQRSEQDICKQFTDAGFEIVEDPARPGTFGVKKNGCLRFFQRDAEGGAAPSGPPYLIVRGLDCELEDRGYQKFWYHQGQRFPIHLADLRTLHRFDEEVRAILGMTSLYNESLGTTCARSVYDRLNGRPDR